MMARDMSIKPCVCDISGERFSVQLRNSALSSEKSHLPAADAALPTSFLSMPFLVPSSVRVGPSGRTVSLTPLRVPS